MDKIAEAIGEKQLKRVVLHNSVRIAGKNFTNRLDPAECSGLVISADLKTGLISASYMGETAIIFQPDHIVFGDLKERKIVQMSHPQVASVVGAQVETPYGHVHAGPGKGKTGK